MQYPLRGQWLATISTTAVLTLVTVASVFANAPQQGPATSQLEVRPKTLLVQFTPEAFRSIRGELRTSGSIGIASVDARLSALGSIATAPVFDLEENRDEKRAYGLDRIFQVDYTNDIDPMDAIGLVDGAEFEFVEPDYLHLKAVTWPNDPDRAEQWYHQNPVFPFGWTPDADGDSEIAWDYETGDPNLVICILDTGVDYDHVEFTGRIVPGYDYVNNDNDPMDDEGHGTSCAGIAAATGNDGIGVVGVVWDGKIMPVKVLDENGEGFSTWIANGITFAADNGADVISMSLGSDSPSSTIENAANYAFNTQGCLLVAATGNDNNPTVGWPAAFPNVMAIGSMSPCLERKSPASCDGEGWWGSNYGPNIDCLAPGVLMLTTDITGEDGYTVTDYYDSFNGTSSATPVAAGAAALIWSYLPGLSNAELRDLIRLSCEDMGPIGFDNETGYGHINPASAIQAYFFVDATSGPLGNNGVSRGLAWGDYDDDGDADLYITNDGSANALLRNDAGTFVDATSGPLGDTGNSYGASFGDADDDGDLDLYIANYGANTYLENTAGNFSDATVTPLDDSDEATSSSWMDYDNDGDLDLYFLNNGTSNRIFVNDGSASFTDVSALPLGNQKEGRGLAWGDIDNDGDMDVYFTNRNAANRLLRNDGGGTFVNISGATGDSNPSNGACFADYDGDGDIDLFLANDGANRLFENDGTGSFLDAAIGTSLEGAENTVGAAWADYDNDGDPDLVTTTEGGRNDLWRNEEGLSFTSIAVLGPLADAGDGQAAAWADYDCDGDMDYYVVNADGANVLIRNDDPGLHNWITLKLEGVASNSGGVGARVRIVSGGMSQIRDITAGTGFCSQNEMVAAFGIGSATSVDTVEVTWPSGAIDVVEDVAANSKIGFIEGQGIPTSVDYVAGIGNETLDQNRPNPFRVSTSIRFRISESGPIDLSIYGVDGRTVRSLIHGTREAGEHQVAWDRRDSFGRSVPSGVYYYQLETPTERTARRLIVIE